MVGVERVLAAARDLRLAARVFDQQFKGKPPRENPRAYQAAERWLDTAAQELFDAVDTLEGNDGLNSTR